MEMVNTYANVFYHKVIDDQRVTTSSETETQPQAREVQSEADLLGPFRVRIREGEDLEIIRFLSCLQCFYTPCP